MTLEQVERKIKWLRNRHMSYAQQQELRYLYQQRGALRHERDLERVEVMCAKAREKD